MGRQRLHGSWWDSQAAQAARPRPRARHPHSRAALTWHGPSRGGLRAVRLGEDAAVKLAIRRSLADVAEAAHQEDVAEALALEEALTVSSREAALLEQLAIDASMMDIMWRDEGRCRCTVDQARVSVEDNSLARDRRRPPG